MTIDSEDWLYLCGQVNGLTVALAEKTSQLEQLESVIVAQLDEITCKVIDLLAESRPVSYYEGPSRPELTIVRNTP
jgi:hypothetical protein